MLSEYISKAIKQAEYKRLEDGSWFGEMAGFEGIWANAKTVEACREELLEVLEEWLFLKISGHDPIPQIEGVALKIQSVA